MKIIHVRGVNGVGKTTAVREYIEKGHFRVETTFLRGKQYFYHWDGETAILGRYDERVTGGVDGYIKDATELKDIIAYIARGIRPRTLVFEGVMYGKTFNFTYEIYNLARALKADFLAICLVPPFDTAMERVWERNGGKDVRVENLERMYKQAITANAKLRMAGVPTRDYDTRLIPLEQMYTILEENI